MAAVSELEEEEPPEEKSNAAAPWLAAVAERYERR